MIKEIRILIADDHQIVSDGLKNILKDIEGLKVVASASNGEEAVEICKKNKEIDLILMDIQMPGINGYEATRQIREFNKNVVIIAQTAFGLSGDKEKSIEAGCNEYISKPIIKENLLALIQKHFS